MQGIEIDFLPVGEGSKSGDAIVMRVGDDFAKNIIVVDGGSLAAGDNAVEHINRFYGSPGYIHHVVCTHQDGDHASGLRRILENFTVGTLWVHQPWLFAEYLVPRFTHRWSVEGLRDHLRNDCFPMVARLCDLAEELGVTLAQPLQGCKIGPFTVLAPSLERYLDLIPRMDQTPTARDEGFIAEIARALRRTVVGTFEGWGFETLGIPRAGDTSITNETSVVMLATFDRVRVLLTGDAGVSALTDAIDGAQKLGLHLSSPDLVQLPHHGSRRNVSPAVLDALLGARLPNTGYRRGTAISSVAAGADGFPRRVVENAFNRRGYDCFTTKGQWINWTRDMTKRPGLLPLSPSPFHDKVED